jgi:hypothetical protein
MLAPGCRYDLQTNYSDGNGPRGAMNASDCCAQCATVADCLFWSFVVDPSQPTVAPGTCLWGTLAYCCVFHATADNLVKLDPSVPSVQCVVVSSPPHRRAHRAPPHVPRLAPDKSVA